MIEIDGSQGEGGGQIVRTALTLAATTGQAVHLTNIRRGRKVPGLRAQHLTAVRALAQICDAKIGGLGNARSASSLGQVGARPNEVIGTELVFEPGPAQPGEYVFDVGTAGSTALVLQTVALPLCLAHGASLVTITGGTHNPGSPCFEYLDFIWAEMLSRMGISLKIEMARAGFYPKGGGELACRIEGGSSPRAICPIELVERGTLLNLHCCSKAARLPISVAQRQRAAAERELAAAGLKPASKTGPLPGNAPGTVCFVGLEFEKTRAAFFSLGALGKRAETVGHEAAQDARQFYEHESGGALDPHAADQLMLPLAIAPGTSRYTTTQITEHTLTNARVIQQVTNRTVKVVGGRGQSGTVVVE